MATIFANAGKIIDYKGGAFKIIQSGISDNDGPYVELEPENEELAQRMREEILKRGNLIVRIDGEHRLVLGKNEFPYS